MRLMRPLLLMLCLVPVLLVAQPPECTHQVVGRVLNIETGEPLPFATVRVKGSKNGTTTREDGYFILKGICEEEVDLEVSHIGFKTLLHHHDFHHGDPTIYLAPEDIMLESVVVEEALDQTKIRTLAGNVTRRDNLGQIGESSGQLLGRTSGVSLLKSGQNVAKPIVHGLHSNRVLIVNNGVRHAYQAWGSEHAPELDASQMDRLEVVKGAATVRYGSDALGGVILIHPDMPEFEQKLKGEALVGFQTNGKAVSSEFSVSKGYDHSAWKIGLSGTRQGDLTAPDYQLTNTAKQEYGLSAALRLHFKPVDVDVYGSHVFQNLGILRGSVVGNLNDLEAAMTTRPPQGTSAFSYALNNPRQQTAHSLLKVKSMWYLDEHRLDAQYAFQLNKRQEYDIRRGTNNQLPSIDLQLSSHTLDVEWLPPMPDAWRTVVGMQALYLYNENIPGTNTIPFVPNYDQVGLGAYTVNSYSWERTTVEVGIRFDFLYMGVIGRDSNNDIFENDMTWGNWTFTGGVIHQLNDKWRVRQNIASAWRAPNVYELYAFGKHQFIVEYGLWRYQLDEDGTGITTGGVIGMDEKEVRAEWGLKSISSLEFTSGKWTGELTPYVNLIKNYFFTRPFGLTNTVRGTFPYFIHDQTDALFTGVDADLRYRINGHAMTELKLAWVRARDTKNNQAFIGIPPFNALLTHEGTFGKFSVSATGEFTARQNDAPPVVPPGEFVDAGGELPFNPKGTFDFLSAPKGYILLHTDMKYQAGAWSLAFGINNLLNTRYRTYTDLMRYFADDMGRNFRVAVKYGFGG
jgi:iron complex outermembrane recepter protein